LIGAAAVDGWHLTEREIGRLAALFAPVQELAYGPLDVPTPPPVERRKAA